MTDDLAIEAQGLAKRFGNVEAVRGVTFGVRRGEFFGFLGPNGAGKTTTIRMLCGLLRPTAGAARVAGHDVAAEPLTVKRKIGIMPETILTFDRLTAWELLQFSAALYDLPRAEAIRRAEVLLDLVDLSLVDRNRLLIDYSQGMKKKVALACALIHGPEVIFLDEPFNGVDALSTQAMQKVLQNLTTKGITVFYTSHVLEVVQKLCTRVAIVEKGALRAMGTLAELGEQAGLAPQATLEDVFVKLLGGVEKSAHLDWIG